MIKDVLSVHKEATCTLLVENEPHLLPPLVDKCVWNHLTSKVPVSVICTAPFVRPAGSDEHLFSVHQLFAQKDGQWTSEKDVLQRLDEVQQAAVGGSLLVLQDVGSLLLWLDAGAVCRWMRRAQMKKQPVLMSLYRDAVADADLASLSYYAAYVARVQWFQLGDGDRTKLRVDCRARQGSSSAELVVLSVRGGGGYDLRATIEDVQPLQSAEKRGGRVPPVQPGDALKDICTFNLQLNDSERKSRDQLVLPYLHQQHQPLLLRSAPAGGTASNLSAGGRIFYQPDAEDDWDDEDPDDDLDI